MPVGDLRSDSEDPMKLSMSIDIDFSTFDAALGCEFFATVTAELVNRMSEPVKSLFTVKTKPAQPRVEFIELINNGVNSTFDVRLTIADSMDCHPNDIRFHVVEYIHSWKEKDSELGEIVEQRYDSTYYYFEVGYVTIDILEDRSVCDYKLVTIVRSYGQDSEETNFTYHYG